MRTAQDMKRMVRYATAGACASLLLVGCASTTMMEPGPATPAATGEIELRVKKNDNNKLTIEADHLPPPENIDPELQTFVVWLRTPEGKSMNLGQLKLAKDRSAKLQTSTPHPAFEIIITIEKTPTASEPGPHVVLSASVE